MIFDKMKHDDETFDNKNEVAVEKEMKLKDNVVEKVKNEKDEDVFDIKATDQGNQNDEENESNEYEAKEVEVDSRMDASTIVSTLHIIFAMVIICGKTLHEQSLLVARLSQLSQSSLLSQLQPKELLSLTSLIVLLPGRVRGVLRGDDRPHSQGVQHGEQG